MSISTSCNMADVSELSSHRFFCREWAFAKLWACLEQRTSTKTCGVLILGGPGTGKTALCRQIIRPRASQDNASQNRHSSALQDRVLAYHFCQASNVHSLSMATFIQRLVAQLRESPLVKGYSSKVCNDEVNLALSPESLRTFPDDALKRAVLFPLLELDAPDKTLLLLIDSIDETALHEQSSPKPCEMKSRNGVSTSIAELIASHHHLFPQWLLLVLTTRRASRHVTKPFSGFRKIALDDLRRSHVVRDVQQYILCRLDTEPALRHHLSRETAEMLNQLHIKSNGCILYLQKVLDGVVEGWVTLREIRDIPGTLNGLYLWLCQRLFPKKLFQKVVPLLSIMLAARTPLSSQELKEAAHSKHPEITEPEEWTHRMDLLKKVLHAQSQSADLVLFHHSFAEWLLDVKHCTQKYLVHVSPGHAMLAMKYTKTAPTLNVRMVQEFAFHLARMPLEGTLEWHHLPLWLVMSDVTLKSCFDDYIIPDTLALRLLKEAGATLAHSEEHLSDSEDGDDKHEAANESKCQEPETPVKILPKNEKQEAKEEPGSPKYYAALDNEKDLLGTLMETPVSSVKSEAILRKSSSQSEQVLSEKSLGVQTGELGAVERKRSSSVGRGSSRSRTCSSDRQSTSERRRKSGDGHVSTHSSVDSFGSHEGSPSTRQKSATNEEQRRHREDPLYPYLRGGPVDQVDAAGRTLLHTASHQGDASLVTLLLERSANLALADRAGQTPLNLASRHGHAEVVSTLLVFGANADHADDDGWTPLRSAAWAGHYEVVLALLNGHVQVDLSDGDGRTALRAAAWGGHEDVVAALLRSGADVNRADADGRTPLIAAAYMGHSEIVESLLTGGADVNHADVDGRTALSVAALCVPASEGHLQVATGLLEAGARVDHQDRDGLTPLLVAAFEGHVDVCELLLEFESDVDHVDKFSRTPLLAAASMGHSKVVEKLLFWGCYVDHIDFEGRTVLSVAAAQGCPDTVRLLLDRGLDETHRDNAGWTPLHYAAFEGHAGVVGSLINAGARVNEVDNDGKHALVLAAHEGHVNVVTTLLDASAALDHTSHDGRSALRVAALEGHVYVVKELVTRGANIHYRDADGRSSLYLLALEDRLDMAAFLLRAGAGVDDTDLDGRTPLHVTAWQGHGRMVELLLGHRARVDALDKERRTPLQSAAWQGHGHVVRILLESGARVDHSCAQGATALSIAAQEGHEQCVSVLLQFGANPSHADGCGRTAIKVALKGGHMRLAKMLEDHLDRKPGRLSGHISAHTPTSPTHSPESTFDKRRSVSSNLSSSTRSSGVAPSHRPPMEPPYAHRTPITHSQQPALSFTQQLQACGRGRRPPTVPPPVLTPLEDDPASPIYASPPTTPTSPANAVVEDEYTLPVTSKDFIKHSSESHQYCPVGTPPLATSSGPSDDTMGFTFTQDQHMRIILGAARSSPESRTRPKRNGIVTNPSLKAAQAKAANILRNGLHGRPRTPDRASGRNHKKETPL